MKYSIWFLVAVPALFFTAGCSNRGESVSALPTHPPQTPISSDLTATVNSGTVNPAQVCPSARGEGTVSPAVTIYSISFSVNSVEQVVQLGDALEAMPGDKLEVKEITICTDEFSGNGGEICVDFVPVDQSGQEIISMHEGTHIRKIDPGFTTISGPAFRWTIGENWHSISAVLNHWPPEDTEDLDCGNRRCEHDDRIIIRFR